ncbi:MAG TPA: type II toxin-antitoxin system VapC family toxin [Pyrinomonadaceae bacterium]|nr:type II toxin-antitoxin system VapC family toxin [Pyrinomonadaceae bacterium]
MITAIDTNVLIALWDEDDALNIPARNALDAAYDAGRLVVSGMVFAELLSGPRRTEEVIEGFLAEAAIAIDWEIDEPIWRNAAKAYQGYSKRRKRQNQKEPRRLLTDFLIGAHAYERKYALLTLDARIFKIAFPRLKVISA